MEILLIDDDRNLREAAAEALRGAGYGVTEAGNGIEALEAMEGGEPDAILCDWRMPVMDGRELLQELAGRGVLRRVPLLVLTAFGDGESAAEAMQVGAYDFLLKPIDLDLLLSKVAAALEHSRLQREIEVVAEWPDGARRAGQTAQMIGRSPLWIEVFKRIGQVARSRLTVLIQGETGTGKEVVARAIHERSERSAGPMVTVNCAAIPAELLESEMFGHERGAFTGATGARVGRFEAAQGGTLFLDEVGELPLALQPKLLRALQERSFQRVGGNQTVQVDVRVIAATNVDLQAEVQARRFRADLFYRLNAYSLRLPALRERREDVPLLTAYFLRRFAERNGTTVSAMSDGAQELLFAYSFPGNVRELEQLIDRLAVGAAGRPILEANVRGALAEERREELTGSAGSGTTATAEAWASLPFHESVARWEQFVIERAMRLAEGNKSEAARRLGIQRRLLYEKLARFDGAPEPDEGSDEEGR